MSTLTFFIPGEPVGKGRPIVGKAFGKRGFPTLRTPEKTMNYEGMVAMLAHQAMKGMPMLRGPLELSFAATTLYPESWSAKRKAANEYTPEYSTKKPDLDNIAKALGDGMNGVVYADDVQIAQYGATRKIYGATPGCWVRVRELLEEKQLDLLPAAKTAAPKPPPAAPAPVARNDGAEAGSFGSLAALQAARAARGQA